MPQIKTISVPPPAPASSNPFVTDNRNDNDNSNNGKKRKRDELNAILPRELLSKISAKEYEDTIKSIEKQRPLTQIEQREVKRQRRALKNREYAQNCRSKKRQMLEACQEANVKLVQEKADLASLLNATQRENERLLCENTHLKIMLNAFGCPMPTPAQNSLPPVTPNNNPNYYSSPLLTPNPSILSTGNKSPQASSTSAPLDLSMTTINVGEADTFVPLKYVSPSSGPVINNLGGKNNNKRDTNNNNYNYNFNNNNTDNKFAPSQFTTICLFTIIFGFGFFFGGSVGGIPGFHYGKSVLIEPTGRSLFGTEEEASLSSSPLLENLAPPQVIAGNGDSSLLANANDPPSLSNVTKRNSDSEEEL